MKRRIHLFLTIAVSMASVVTCGSQLQANDYQQINRLAREIERESRQVERETRHFRQTPFYFELLGDAQVTLQPIGEGGPALADE
jgi:hypothetical protein